MSFLYCFLYKRLPLSTAASREIIYNLRHYCCANTRSGFSLAAMAFIVKGERERAERILDFYAEPTKR
jgi:hypothetical protein